MQAELLLAARAALGEGSLWDAATQRLYWIDIISAKVFVYDPATGSNQTFDTGSQVGTVVPRKSGGLMVALATGFAFLDTTSGRVELWTNPERANKGSRFNDGKCDPAGRFWAGSIAEGFRKGGANLWCLETDRTITKKLDNVTCSNGIVWTADNKTMYYIDTPTRKLDRFDYDLATGAIANRRAILEVPENYGGLDGMTIDAEGMLWVALWGGGRVERIDPAAGKVIDTIQVPGVTRVTSCAFGGPNLDTLYITSAAQGVTDFAAEPNAGGLFVVPIKNTRGVEALAYGG